MSTRLLLALALATSGDPLAVKKSCDAGKDPARAAELFRQACNGGSSVGCRKTFEK